jgi:DNA-binding transcriptional LysR family regulator
MPRIVQWEQQIGRRLRLRDLFVFFTVVKCGSMAKAAAQLNVSTPSISEIIADLERLLGVRLLDRSPHGVLTTPYGEALLKRSEAAFDELRQGVRDIEFLADPAAGELKIGCSDSIIATMLPPIIEHFRRQHPRVVLHVDNVTSPAIRFPGLRDRKYDLVLARFVTPRPDDHSTGDLNEEFLFDDPLVVAAGMHTRWARRRQIDLAELIDAPWILPASGTWTYSRMAEAFQALGLDMPKASLVTLAWPLVAHFLVNGQFITGCARSVARLSRLKELPVDLPVQPWPVLMVTLKNRTLSPVVGRFMESARAVAKSIAVGPRTRKSGST